MTDSHALPFDAVLCDVDNVIRHFDNSGIHALERATGLAEGTTFKVAFAPEAAIPLVLGHITGQEWVGLVAQGLSGLVDESTAWDLGRALLESPFKRDDTVVTLLRRARVHVPLVLVTNASVELEADLAEMQLTDLADHVVSSARIGLAKPDPRIYHLAVQLAGVPAERCLFVDDTLENVEAARALGMSVVHFREAADLERALEPLFT
ncbi:MAG TPA: HAD-IA family hydrolase [Streptomyces sp.]